VVTWAPWAGQFGTSSNWYYAVLIRNMQNRAQALYNRFVRHNIHIYDCYKTLGVCWIVAQNVLCHLCVRNLKSYLQNLMQGHSTVNGFKNQQWTAFFIYSSFSVFHFKLTIWGVKTVNHCSEENSHRVGAWCPTSTHKVTQSVYFWGHNKFLMLC
jgi:hypothetical protein